MSWTKRIIGSSILASAILVFGAGTALAQSHDQRHERADFKDHQRQERRDYGRNNVRFHQREESRAFKEQERNERAAYYGAYGQYSNGYPVNGYPYPSHANGYPPSWGYGDPSNGSQPYYHAPYSNHGRHHGYDDHH